jgi:hypothetical protein
LKTASELFVNLDDSKTTDIAANQASSGENGV